MIYGFFFLDLLSSFVIRELLICTTDGFSNGKTSTVVSLPQWLSGPLCVVELGGQTNDNLTHAHVNEIEIPTILD